MQTFSATNSYYAFYTDSQKARFVFKFLPINPIPAGLIYFRKALSFRDKGGMKVQNWGN